MSTPEGRIEMMGMMDHFFNSVDAGQPLDATGFWAFHNLSECEQDKIAGGHWLIDQTAHRKSTEYCIELFGTDGKMSLDQFLGSIPVFMKHIKPLIKE